MKPVALAPKSQVLMKPPHGAPCNRCGLCCTLTLCPLGSHVFHKEIGPCPALEKTEDGLTACGLVAHPEAHALVLTLQKGKEALSDAAKWLTATGLGCDCRTNGEPPDKEFYRKGDQWDWDNRKKVAKARKVWGI